MAHTPPCKPDWWPKSLIGEHETAELTGIPVTTLRYWRCVRTVSVPYVKIGKHVRYEPDSLWRYVCANTVRSAACV